MSRWKIVRRRSVRAYKAVFTVPHGCAGSATTKIRVQIPEGVIAVKPMPKPGWSVEAISGKYAAEYELSRPQIHRRRQGSGVERRQAADSHYDEFVISTYLTRQSEAQHHAVFSGGAGMRAGGQPLDRHPGAGAGHSHDDKSPAPGVKLMPKP
jgi:uncharacterized protein YcnI